MSPKPKLSEMQDVLNIQHFVRCIEHMCLNSEDWGMGGFASGYAHDDDEITREKSPSELRTWRERFSRAMYRVFFAGAVFYRVYNEPFSSQAERPAGIPREYLEEWNFTRFEHAAEYIGYDDSLSVKGAQFLQRFPVYNMCTTDDEEEFVFGAFARWLVEDGRALAEQNQCPEKGDLDADQVSAIWEIMAMTKAYEHLKSQCHAFKNSEGQIGLGGPDPTDEAQLIKTVMPGPTRQVSIIIFGYFGLEDVTMPSAVADSLETGFIADPASVYRESGDPILNSAGKPINADVSIILDTVYRFSGHPNHVDGFESCPMDLNLFKYTLKVHFNLMFWTEAFNSQDKYQPWTDFVNSAALWHRLGSKHTRYGLDMLEVYRPRTLSYTVLG